MPRELLFTFNAGAMVYGTSGAEGILCATCFKLHRERGPIVILLEPSMELFIGSGLASLGHTSV